MHRLIEVVVVVLGTVAVTGCTFNSGGGQNSPNPAQAQAYQDQVDAFNRQAEEAEKQLKAQHDQLERTKQHLDLAERIMLEQEKGVERYNNIMAKWEEQSRRRDALLDAEEQKAGIKPTKRGEHATT